MILWKIPVPEARELQGFAADLALRAYFGIQPTTDDESCGGLELVAIKEDLPQESFQAKVRRVFGERSTQGEQRP